MPSLTIIGLGTGLWKSLTIEASDALREAGTVYVRTEIQPRLDTIRAALSGVEIHSFDSLYDNLASLEDVNVRIVEQVLDLAQQDGGVVYAVPGSPSVGETTVQMLTDRCGNAHIPVRVIEGISVIEPALAAVGVFDLDWLQIFDAAEVSVMGSENAVGEVPTGSTLLPWRSPTTTAAIVVAHLFDRATASGVKLWLRRFYPDDHAIRIIDAMGTPESSIREVPLHELDRLHTVDHRTVVYVPPLDDLDNVRTFAGLMNVTRRLRGPGGCPWDREQTHASLKTYLLEEAYEVIDALDGGEPDQLAEELGDLLYQITIHSQVASEAGEFTIEDVLQNIISKMIGRHPHVFGELQLETAQDVRHAWEGFKQRQKPKRGSVMEGIPGGLPALPQSNLMQKRAASVGFEWPTATEVVDKVEEEIAELRMEIQSGASKDLQREELGDILFALVSVSRHLRIDPEEALRLANRKFVARFVHVESQVAADGKALRDLTADQLNVYWNRAKSQSTESPATGI